LDSSPVGTPFAHLPDLETKEKPKRLSAAGRCTVYVVPEFPSQCPLLQKMLTSMQLHFRSAAFEDLTTLLVLGEEFYCEQRIRVDPIVVKTALSQLLRDTSLGRVWLLDVAGAPIGYLIMLNGFIVEFGGRQVFIDELYIRPEFRGHGLGRKTLAFAEQACRQAGITIIRLEVDRANRRLIEFYEEFGFKLHGRLTMTRLLD
jgi:GNAT superfamily N-acetyltransferase